MKLTNRQFSEQNKTFRGACKAVKLHTIPSTSETKTLPPTQRQASKFRMEKGLAFTVGFPKYLAGEGKEAK